MLLVSCATSPEVYNIIDAEVSHGDFEAAIHEIVTKQDEGRRKAIYPQRNTILLYLDKGMIEHYAGNYRDSSNDLEQAERLIEEAFTKSIAQDAASYIVNDNTKEYSGEDYEDLYINVFNALNYSHRGDLEGAGVEIRRLTEKLVKLESKYTEGMAKAQSAMKVQSAQLPESKPVNFSNSALARYVSGIVYRAQGEADFARIDFVSLKDAYAASPVVYKNPLSSELEMTGGSGNEKNAELDIPRGKARLNIVAFAGLSPVKEESRIDFFLPFQYAWSAAVAVPVLKARSSVITRIEAVIDGQETVALDLLEDMGAVMTQTYNAKLSMTMVKTFVRTIAKYVAVEAAGRAAAEQGGENAGRLAALVAKLTVDLSESADIRSGRYFPGKAYVGGITLEPGNYTVTVTYYSGNKTVASYKKENVRVGTSGLNLVETVCLK